MKHYMDVMGLECKDKVTGFIGFVECISFDLYGCVQVALKPKMDKDGKVGEGKWFDHKRLVVINDKPVMELPDFSLAEQERVSTPKAVVGRENGPAEKPGGRFNDA